ncbi:MAG: hypothetical protein EP311_09340 [Cytophagales bacterium]|uniref:LTXXQ motif family protein n=1 Tax=Algoriphagus taiwanensis TaxID=1445656 RepID=A0ABQ6Q7U5_9BACT|nr:MAG: hypothetical protein EP311_09340 [Cytophagales bacterium]GMQ35077.1 hypothetical protein Ataiwa_33500 [Algoriphagus taiwanensis]
MKKIQSLLITLVLVLVTWESFAQRPGQIDPEKLQAARIAFITTRIDLKPEQAEKFWPIFNEYNDKREATMRQIAELNRNSESISEEQAKERIKKRFELQQALLNEEQQFVQKASGVLTAKQILMLNNIARDFTRQLYQRQRGGGGGGF